MSTSIIPFAGLFERVYLRCSGAPPACSSGSLGPYIGLGPEVGGCPLLTQGITSLSILDQPIDFTQKVPLLRQVEVFLYLCIHWLPQLMPVVVCNRLVLYLTCLMVSLITFRAELLKITEASSSKTPSDKP
jgi:hypothetical protein